MVARMESNLSSLRILGSGSAFRCKVQFTHMRPMRASRQNQIKNHSNVDSEEDSRAHVVKLRNENRVDDWCQRLRVLHRMYCSAMPLFGISLVHGIPICQHKI